jgi:hypothetical protein
MIKHTMTAAALAAVLAVPAFAQQPSMNNNPAPAAQPSSPSSSMPSPSATTAQKTGFVQSQDANEWRGSKVIGASVYGPDNSSIGEINDVIIGSDGQIKAAVIGVGGFLGVGQKDVAVPFQELNVSRKPDSTSIDKVTVSYTKDQLKNAPTFAYYQPPGSSSQTTGSSTGMGSSSPSSTSNTMKK